MSSKKSLLVLIFLILQQLFGFSRAQICGTTGNYSSRSTYQTNLITLLSSLPTNMDPYGFYNASVGQSPDRVNAIAMCRADIQLDLCQLCVQNATIELVKTCPNQRQAIWWNVLCMIRYSDVPIFGTVALLPGRDHWSLRNVTSPLQFLTDLSTLLASLRSSASDSLHKVAAGSIDSADLQTIFAMVQCTPDLSSVDCNSCLLDSIREMARCCSASAWVEIFSPSCNIYYDTQPFVNGTRLQEIETTGPTPPYITPPPVQTSPLLSPPMRTPPFSSTPGLLRPLPFPPPLPSSSANGNDYATTLTTMIFLSIAAGLLQA